MDSCVWCTIVAGQHLHTSICGYGEEMGKRGPEVAGHAILHAGDIEYSRDTT